MKNILLILLCLLSLSTFAATPIRDGVLQGPLNASGNAVSNVGILSTTGVVVQAFSRSQREVVKGYMWINVPYEINLADSLNGDGSTNPIVRLGSNPGFVSGTAWAGTQAVFFQWEGHFVGNAGSVAEFHLIFAGTNGYEIRPFSWSFAESNILGPINMSLVGTTWIYSTPTAVSNNWTPMFEIDQFGDTNCTFNLHNLSTLFFDYGNRNGPIMQGNNSVGATRTFLAWDGVNNRFQVLPDANAEFIVGSTVMRFSALGNIGTSDGVWSPTHYYSAPGGDINLISSGNARVTWTTGSGSPEGVVAAPVGSMYSRVNGGAGTTLYVKESGTGNTGWVGK